MNSIKNILSKNSEDEIISSLKEIYKNHTVLKLKDIYILKNYENQNDTLNGIIGLLTQSNPHILLGVKQNSDLEIKHWCETIHITEDHLISIAQYYLNDDYSETPECVVRKVMEHYPTLQV